MKLAVKTDVVSCAGCVRIELRTGNGFTVSVLSPRAARQMAQHLMTSADDAEAWDVEDGGVHTPREQRTTKKRRTAQALPKKENPST